jgi:hypothetical protein
MKTATNYLTFEWLDKVAPPSWAPPADEVAAALLPSGGEFDGGRPKRVVIKAMGD